MNHINDPLVTPVRIQKAFKINPDGVRRLAKFVGVDSVGPMRIFEGCQQQRVATLKLPKIVDRRVK